MASKQWYNNLPSNFTRVKQARYGWREVICPQTNLGKRIITCTKYENQMIDGELHNIETLMDSCNDNDCNNNNCQYRKPIEL